MPTVEYSSEQNGYIVRLTDQNILTVSMEGKTFAWVFPSERVAQRYIDTQMCEEEEDA